MYSLIFAFLLIAWSAFLYLRDARGWVNAMPLMAGLAIIGFVGLTSGALGPLSIVFLLALLLSPLAILILMVALLCNGVVMIRREGFGVTSLLSFAAGLWILALYAGGILFITLKCGPFWLFLWITLVMVTAYPAFALISFLVSAWLYSRRREPAAEHDIIVLGSSVASGKVPPLLAARLDAGITQWHRDREQGFDSIIIPSGGKGSDEPLAEGLAMADYLVSRGIPRGSIIVEDKARNTVENLQFGAELARMDDRADRLVVATSQYHAMRAAQLCRDLELPAHVIGGRTALYFLPSAYIREFIALMKRRWPLHLLLMAGLFLLGLAGALVASRS
ncbi:MAG: YdcF family protein [Propionibacteriaceae bacterium]